MKKNKFLNKILLSILVVGFLSIFSYIYAANSGAGSVTVNLPAGGLTTPANINITVSGTDLAGDPVTVTKSMAVNPPSTIGVTLSANISNMTLPANTTVLTWTTTGSPTSCTGSGDTSWNGSKTTSGGNQTITYTTAGTYTYNITCSKTGLADATLSVPVTVTVNPASSAPSGTIVATPASCTAPCNISLSYSSNNIYNNSPAIIHIFRNTTDISTQNGNVSGTYSDNNLNAGSYKYCIRGVTSTSGYTSDLACSSVVVGITATLTASPSTLTLPTNSTTLTWVIGGAPDSCIASGSWTGSKSATNGTHTQNITGLVAGTYTYILTCSKTGLPDVVTSTTVKVTDVPITLACSPSTQNISTGDNFTVNASGGNGTYLWSAPGAAVTSSTLKSFSSSYSTTGSKTITLTSAGNSTNCTINVSAPTPPGPITSIIKLDGYPFSSPDIDAPVSVTTGSQVHFWMGCYGNTTSANFKIDKAVAPNTNVFASIGSDGVTSGPVVWTNNQTFDTNNILGKYVFSTMCSYFNATTGAFSIAPANYYYIDIVPAVNTAPNTPTVTGPTSGLVNTSYTYTFNSIDPQGDDLRYGVDWDMDGIVDEWIPSGSPAVYVTSGTDKSVTHSWSSNGSQVFQVLAQDSSGLNSLPALYTMDINPALSVNIVATPPGPLYLPNPLTTLSWTTTGNPELCSTLGQWSGYKNPNGGSQLMSFSLSGTYTFGITCSKTGFTSVNSSINIIVNVPPAVSVTPASIYTGESTLLSWYGGASGSCVGTNFDTKGAISGSLTVKPLSTITYSISCNVQGIALPVTGQATVTVKHRPGFIEN